MIILYNIEQQPYNYDIYNDLMLKMYVHIWLLLHFFPRN